MRYCPQVPQRSLSFIAPEEKLLRAAKARIQRMVAEKSRRRDLQVPENIRNEWQTGDKTALAHILQQVNWDRVP